MRIFEFSIFFSIVFLEEQFFLGGSEGRRVGPINIVWNGKQPDEQIEPDYLIRD